MRSVEQHSGTGKLASTEVRADNQVGAATFGPDEPIAGVVDSILAVPACYRVTQWLARTEIAFPCTHLEIPCRAPVGEADRSLDGSSTFGFCGHEAPQQVGCLFVGIA